MRSALVLVILTVLAAACGKKPAPAAPKQGTDEKTPDADRAPDVEAVPRTNSSDPCRGGEDDPPPQNP